MEEIQMQGVSMLGAAADALGLILDPTRLAILAGGVLMGLALGILPGVGGTAGIAILLPFTFSMDPYAAFALLLGLGAVVTTGDTIPAVLFGVPGTSGSQATILDGHPMAKQGEAGRALAAAYTASLLGGLFGAALLAVSIPVLQPIMMHVASPELLALAIFGISMVATLSGNAPLRGLTAACFGIMMAMVGSDMPTSSLRWTMGTIYLWEGLPLVPIALGLFALPELADLMIGRKSVGQSLKYDVKTGMLLGAKDTLRNWWLVLRCSWIGAGLGAIPGIGSSVVDWIAYGHALRTEKAATETFGKGDVRGVIAPESSNNAKDGGSLVPTVVFGVPGSSGMALLLVAFMVHGLVPGPDMVTIHLDVTYSMVWSIAIANIIGAGMCFLWSGQFAKIATLRFTLILPTVLSIVYIGAFEGRRDWGDLYLLLSCAVLGWVMKQLKWPRPPLVLGVVLGSILERYLFISVTRYGVEWMLRPLVLVILAITLIGLLRPLVQDAKAHGGASGILADFGRPRFRINSALGIFFIAVIAVMLTEVPEWAPQAQVVPLIVGVAALIFASVSILNETFRRTPMLKPGEGPAPTPAGRPAGRIHMDLSSDLAHVPRRLILVRAGRFFAWLVGFIGSMSVIGLIPTVPIFVTAFMRVENREPWKLVLPQAIILPVFIYLLFDRLLTVPWPPTLIGAWFPAVKALGIPSI